VVLVEMSCWKRRRAKVTSLLEALAWWTSTARTLSPASSHVAGTSVGPLNVALETVDAA